MTIYLNMQAFLISPIPCTIEQRSTTCPTLSHSIKECCVPCFEVLQINEIETNTSLLSDINTSNKKARKLRTPIIYIVRTITFGVQRLRGSLYAAPKGGRGVPPHRHLRRSHQRRLVDAKVWSNNFRRVNNPVGVTNYKDKRKQFLIKE